MRVCYLHLLALSCAFINAVKCDRAPNEKKIVIGKFLCKKITTIKLNDEASNKKCKSVEQKYTEETPKNIPNMPLTYELNPIEETYPKKGEISTMVQAIINKTKSPSNSKISIPMKDTKVVNPLENAFFDLRAVMPPFPKWAHRSQSGTNENTNVIRLSLLKARELRLEGRRCERCTTPIVGLLSVFENAYCERGPVKVERVRQFLTSQAFFCSGCFLMRVSSEFLSKKFGFFELLPTLMNSEELGMLERIFARDFFNSLQINAARRSICINEAANTLLISKFYYPILKEDTMYIVGSHFGDMILSLSQFDEIATGIKKILHSDVVQNDESTFLIIQVCQNMISDNRLAKDFFNFSKKYFETIIAQNGVLIGYQITGLVYYLYAKHKIIEGYSFSEDKDLFNSVNLEGYSSLHTLCQNFKTHNEIVHFIQSIQQKNKK